MTNQNTSDAAPHANVPEFSVSELAFSLKKTLEDAYGRVRVRGELSRVKIHTSGHMYSDLKDDSAVVNLVCWKGTLSKLSIRPEEGLEVICTGRISTYPARSNYQMVVEAMELAGEGALLKMLEERKTRLAGEGLFAAERKKRLPFLPERIGIVTSPTGAVIRDIMHRLDDRFPRPVWLWPVNVQGEGAADQIAAAIDGFNALPADRRPDLLIVARGGGSLEDLMAFNEENVVRAAAASTIPLISAVGHETDTTLIDYAADIRAPTPTGAAEMAVPRRIDLLAQISEDEQRLISTLSRTLDGARDRTLHLAARLGDPRRLLDMKTQALDHTANKLKNGFERRLSHQREALAAHAGRLRHPRNLLAEAGRMLALHSRALNAAGNKIGSEQDKRLTYAGRMLESLSFKSVLNRGYVVVRDENGTPVTEAGTTHDGQIVTLGFKNDQNVAATIGKTGAKEAKSATKTAKQDKKAAQNPYKSAQGQLF